MKFFFVIIFVTKVIKNLSLEKCLKICGAILFLLTFNIVICRCRCFHFGITSNLNKIFTNFPFNLINVIVIAISWFHFHYFKTKYRQQLREGSTFS